MSMPSTDVIHDENGTKNDSNGEVHNESSLKKSVSEVEDSTESSLVEMKKGLFGKSAEYLKTDNNNESAGSSTDDSPVKSGNGNKPNDSSSDGNTEDGIKSNASGAASKIEKTGNATLPLSKESELSADVGVLVSNEEGTGIQISEERGKGEEKHETDRSTINILVTDLAETVHANKGGEASENEQVKEELKEGSELMNEEPDTKKSDDAVEDVDTTVENVCEVLKKSEVVAEDREELEEEDEEEEKEDSKGPIESANLNEAEIQTRETPQRTTRSHVKRVSASKDSSAEEPTSSETPVSKGKLSRNRKSQGRKSSGDTEVGGTETKNIPTEDSAKNEDNGAERRRSLRTPKAVAPTNTPVLSTARGTKRKTVTKGKATDIEKESGAVKTDSAEKVEESPARKRRATKQKLDTPVVPSASTHQTPKRDKAASRAVKSEGRPSRKGTKTKKNDSSHDDPFSLDDNLDNHPEPLRNIQMERQSFGNIKYTKSSSEEGATVSRFEKTEQTASERRSNLPDLLLQHKADCHKSLSELSVSSPSIRRQLATPKAKSATHQPKKDSGLFTDLAEDGDNESNINMKKADDEKMEVVESDFGEITKSSKKGEKSADVSSISSPTSARKRKSATETHLITPKMRPSKVQIPELSVQDQYAADHRENEHVPYSIGARVFALWDKEYYPAVISADRDSSGRYGVLFVEDKISRRLVATGIIPLSSLIIGKKCLTAVVNSEGTEVMEDVEVVDVPDEGDAAKWMEGIYGVKTDSGEVCRRSWQKLSLDNVQGKELQTETVNVAGEVIADNIESVAGRRSRAARHTSRPSFSSFGSPATSERTSMTPRTASKSKAKQGKRSVGDSTFHNAQDEHINAEDVSNAAQSTDPAHMFDGLYFVVTSALRKNKGEDEGFSKREVRQMIESRHGTVIDDFSKVEEGVEMFLIADTHYRTHKYLSALARSVPCVSHRWIRDCVIQNTLLDYKKYMLPAGISLLGGEVCPWHSRNRSLLSGKKVFIYSAHFIPDPSVPNFVQVWSPLIEHMGAEVVHEMPSDRLDILLTDVSCEADILEKAKSFGAIIISSEWIIQSIILGKLPPADIHERFRYDYVEKAD